MLSVIVAVKKKKNSFKVWKFYLATTEKMGKIKRTRKLLHSIPLTRKDHSYPDFDPSHNEMTPYHFTLLLYSN